MRWLGMLLAAFALAAAPVYAPVTPDPRLSFPRDHGGHPQFRTEWWYVTGWLDAKDGPVGFQVTFFRTRPEVNQANPSAFAPRQVLFAHAALSDRKVGRLLHDQRIARAGFGLAEASTSDADIVLLDWRLRRAADGRFLTTVDAKDFGLDLTFTPTQPILLQGRAGYSAKGPRPEQASYYYSAPHLAASGTLIRNGRPEAVKGRAWLDREWSSTLLDARAVGWDWAGINLDDGSALTVFQVRDKTGEPVWAGGSFRDPRGRQIVFQPPDVRFETVRRWRSPRTGGVYPVERIVVVRLPSGERRFRLRPLFDDQELDSRAGGGPVYWEGAVRTEGGRGYLELTGYAGALKL